MRYVRQVNKNRHKECRERINPDIFNFCQDHYKIYFDEAVPNAPFARRLFSKFAIKSKLIKIVELNYMALDKCFYCKFGSGGYDKKTELPPV